MPRYDIPRLLQFDGPSTQRDQEEPAWISILDYRNTDENAHKAAILLSSQGVPFHLYRPGGKGWSQSKIRIYINVPRERLDEAQAVLAAAAEQGEMERVEGTSGLPGFSDEE